MFNGKNLAHFSGTLLKSGPLSRVAVAAILSSATVVASAQDDQGVGVSVGDSDIYPSVRLDYLHNDNAYLTEDNQIDSTSVSVSPSVVWRADRRTVNVEASYSGNYSKSSESALDYDDHSLGLSTGAEFNKRLAGSVELGLSQGHEELGTNLTQVDSEAYDEQLVFRDLSFLSRLRYGAREAKGNIEASILLSEHKPTTLKELSAYTEYTLVRPSLLFSYRVSPDTRLVLETRLGQYDYKTGDRDRDELNLLTGMNFAATGKLRGSFRVGVSRSDYDNNALEDSTELYLSSNMTYIANDYSRLYLRFSRDFDNDARTDLSAVTDYLNLAWQYQWSDRFSHNLTVGRSSKSRECPERGEATTYFSLEGDVSIRRWLAVGAGFYQQSRNGDTCEELGDSVDSLDYDRQMVGVHLKATL